MPRKPSTYPERVWKSLVRPGDLECAGMPDHHDWLVALRRVHRHGQREALRLAVKELARRGFTAAGYHIENLKVR